VLLIGGASGEGKSGVSYRLAQHFGVGITEVDDFQVVLERMTTPAQQPVIHYWRTHTEEALAMDDEQKLAFIIRLSRVLTPALGAGIASHLGGTPIAQEAERLGVPTLPARPWETVLRRAIAALD
jgi:hypothetical protein